MTTPPEETNDQSCRVPKDVFKLLAAEAPKWRSIHDWPLDSLRLCGRHGIFAGLCGLPQTDRSRDVWAATDQIETLIALAKADLLTTFVITQHIGAIKRIVASDRIGGAEDASTELQASVLPPLLAGDQIASVGISHLTTSRMHLRRPVVVATPVEAGYRLSGTIPWVTGAPKIQWIVVGATLDDATQILVLLSLNDDGVRPGPGAELVAMSASCTDAVELDNVLVAAEYVLSGPRENVLAGPQTSTGVASKATGAGGLQTSALALGLSAAALDYLRHESIRRSNLVPIVDRFEIEFAKLHETIRMAAGGNVEFDSAAIRSDANGLVQRTTNAAMTTAKGAGLMVNHPVGRWCQQALFFLVWSCPQPVADAHLCELAGITGEIGR